MGNWRPPLNGSPDLAHEAKQSLVHRDPQGQLPRKISIVEVEDVLLGVHGPHGADGRRFVALAGNADGGLALAVQHDPSLAQEAAHHHLMVHREEIFVGEPRGS